MGVLRLDGQAAAVGHGVAGIDRQVEDDVFQLVRIGIGPPEAAGQNRLQPDIETDRVPQQVRHVRNQSVDVQGFGLKRLLA